MITRTVPAHWFSLALILSALLASGCAVIPVTERSAVEFRSYDLPDRLDFNTVIRAVELAFVQTLATTPRIIEGSVLSPLPARPTHFTVEDRRVHLERLGLVTIREVGCPGSLAIMHAWVADHSESQGIRRYTACIQLYAGAYRVHLIDSRLVSKSSDSLTGLAETGLKPLPSLLPRVAQAFVAHIKVAREVTHSLMTESFPSDWKADDEASIAPSPSIGNRVPSTVPLPEISGGSTVGRRSDQDGVATSPLVCLAPRHEAAAVRTQHGRGIVIQVLEQGSLVAVDESVDAAYFRVMTTEGLAGWVNRSDVRRLPCPIG